MAAKIIGICASPRKGKSTRYFLDNCLQAAAESSSVVTEIVDLAEMDIHGCISCDQCKNEFTCSQEDDFQALLPLMSEKDVSGLILATPVYFGGMSSQAKAFLDRCVIFRRNGALLRNKVGGAIAVGGFRHGGQETTVHSVHAAMLIQDMIVVGDGNTTFHFGGTAWSGYPQGYEQDEFGLATVRNLGKRVAEVAVKMSS